MVEKLKKLTEDAPSLAKLDAAAGVPKGTFSNVINGHRLPRIDNAAKLARALNVSLDWLADDDAEFPAQVAGLPRVDKLLAAATREKLAALADAQGGVDVCLAAAVEAFVTKTIDEQSTPLAVVRQRHYLLSHRAIKGGKDQAGAAASARAEKTGQRRS